MKKVLILITVCLFAIVTANRNKHKLRNQKSELMFSTESMLESKEKPVVMEHIFTAKPIKVQASYSTVGEEAKQDLSTGQRFKENSQNANNYDLKNLEAPTIVKSLGYEAPFNVGQRVAQQMDQSITNRQAYDLLYPTHKSYYNDKRFIVFDRNFNQVESYLLNQFKSAIDSAIDYSANSKLERVEDFNKSKVNLRGMHLQQNAPMINREAVETSMKYDTLNNNVQGLKVTSSDPYGTIFGAN